MKLYGFWNSRDRRSRHRHVARAKPLAPDISVKFGGRHRYGLIGANGCGKSSFMKIPGGELESAAETVAIGSN
jgi:ATPase subunit of ABC transporter with duplicated ATPase domains